MFITSREEPIMQTLTINNINDARHEANIIAKAATLFTTAGYRFRQFSTCPTMFTVFPPQVEKTPYIVDTKLGTCTCKGFEGAGTCSHLIAIEEEAANLRQCEDYEDMAWGRELMTATAYGI
jgi:hypothetical protein